MKEASIKAERPMEDMANKARKSYEQTVRTGQRLQEEAGNWWTRMMTQTATATDWQRQFANFTTLANNVMPMAQRRMEDAMGLMEKNSRTSAELMKKAVDAAQTPSVAESQAKWLEFWTSSLKALQSNVEAYTEISTKTIDSWIDFVRKNTERTEIRVPKTA
ncbi:MAG TPA: hypothetical protein VEC99_14015 [Clostridia bacterium]|nr:hypothetical protein [Clostridia bacterium]